MKKSLLDQPQYVQITTLHPQGHVEDAPWRAAAPRLDKSEHALYSATMPREQRIVLPGVAHHITHRGNNRESVFFEDEDRLRYLNLLEKYAKEHGMRILGYCLMTNHVHIVAVPAEKDSLSRAMKSSQLEHASYINQKYGRCGHLWHGRFYSCPMDLDHTISALSYVELNPVRAGMIALPWDYTWSSASAHCGGRNRLDLLDLERWFSHFSDSEWRDGLMVEMENKGFLDKIRQHTRNGRPLGDRLYFKRWLPDD